MKPKRQCFEDKLITTEKLEIVKKAPPGASVRFKADGTVAVTPKEEKKDEAKK